MLSIGQFSKICKVSTKTLRYYEEIGLIYPDKINSESGYRYYSLDQLKKMLFIDRLKSYNFSLEEIKTILNLDEDELEEKLCLALSEKKMKIQNKLHSLECTMNQLSSDISNLKQGIGVMSYLENIDVQLVEYPKVYILSLRKMLNQDECKEGYGKFFYKLYEKISTGNLTMHGPPMTIYHSAEYFPTGYDIEFAIPVKEFVTGTRNFNPGLCLKTVLKGSYSKITSIYAKHHEWAENENYKLSKQPFDIYVNNPYEILSPEELITEIYYPVKKI